MTNPRRMMMASSSPDAIVTFTDITVDTASKTVYTFSAQSLGTANASRNIIVPIHTRQANVPLPTSVTIAGISASLLYKPTHTNSAIHGIQWWGASVPTGTTGDIVVTFSGPQARCGIGVYALLNSSLTVADSFINETNNPSGTINISAGGVVTAAAAGESSPTFTWTGVTENYDRALEVSNISGASDAFASIQTAHIVSVVLTVNSRPVMQAIAFDKA